MLRRPASTSGKKGGKRDVSSAREPRVWLLQVGVEPVTLRLTAVLVGWSHLLCHQQKHSAELAHCSGKCSDS